MKQLVLFQCISELEARTSNNAQRPRAGNLKPVAASPAAGTRARVDNKDQNENKSSKQIIIIVHITDMPSALSLSSESVYR
jgi:hypothetical protein